MSISKELRKECTASIAGTYAPQYFRLHGIRLAPDAPITEIRANMIYSLFTETTPLIFKNDLVAGSARCLFVEGHAEEIEHARRVIGDIRARNFTTNSDHFAPNYDHTLAVGIPGLYAEIDASLAAHADDEKKCATLRAMKRALDGFCGMISNYAKKARALVGTKDYDSDRLESIAERSDALLRRAPESFAEALQLVWYCHTAFVMEGRYAMALGRMDQYLFPFYEKDVSAGRITPDEATTLLECVFMKIGNDVVNIAIGGTSPDGSCDVNELSYCVLHAVKNCQVPGPNLSARISPNTPDEFIAECLKSIGTGLGYPALMNDAVMIPALASCGYKYEDVCNYSMVGCIENFITGKQVPWNDNRFDTPRFIEYVFNRGVSHYGHSAGLDLGDVDEIDSMDEFVSRLEKEFDLGVSEYCNMVNGYNASIDQEYYAQPFLSMFCDDCIGRGLDINCGGAIYPSVHGAALMGVGTVADSLAAIEKVVFVDRAATLAELRDAMNANFEGYDSLRSLLLAAPKYGNNDDFVDKYAVWFLDYLKARFDRRRTRDGGKFYVLMAANTQNISAGHATGATPDGRKAGEPLSDAASPTYGRDTHGPTVTLTSVAKPDYTKSIGGTVVNQKFSPSAFEEDRLDRLVALVKVYFKKGGQELQINATSREVLEDAMEHPDNYGDLVVRVSGFSAYYTTLGRDVQLDILNRTQHE